MIRRRWPAVLLACVVAALAVRLTVRDGVRVAAPIFYATPPGVLVAASLLAGAAAARRKERRLAVVASGVVAAVAAELVASSCFAAPASAPGEVRALFWNVLRGRMGWDAVAGTIRAADPDVAWLDECRDEDGAPEAAFRRALPGHGQLRVAGGLVVLVRGEASLLERRDLPGNGRAAVERIEVRGRTLHAVHVDIASDPFLDRGLSFAVLDAMKAPYLDGPLVVAGDFNTPRESAYFDPWRGPLVHAFEAAGGGWAPTWPVPFPVLALDHVWVSRAVTVRTCEHGWTSRSDHRPVIVTIDFADAPTRR